MNLDQVTQLLKMMAVVDRRIVGEPEILMWAGLLQGVTFADAAVAVSEHYGKSTEYLMPVHVKTIARRLMKERIESTPEPLPPSWALESGEAYAGWKRGWLDEVKAGTYVPKPAPILVRRDVRAITGMFRKPTDQPDQGQTEEAA